jgi:hypothetical protein
MMCTVFFCAGTPRGSTQVDSLLQTTWLPQSMERGTEHNSQETSLYAPRPKIYLVAKHRVSSLDSSLGIQLIYL